MAGKDRRVNVPPALVAAAGWALPGAGYWLIGHRARGVVVGITILLLFAFGILLAGIRVIDVPGYDRAGLRVRIEPGPSGRRLDPQAPSDEERYFRGNWALVSRGFFGEIANKPWYVGQILTGPVCLIASSWSLSAARQGVGPSHGRLYEIGTLYTAVAGMLNLLVMIDASSRAGAKN
jgi:hypothetical protein